ncbi:MAG: FadR family transcriptional regulator [Rhizobiales bacterium]|nr:FadR family transcriptional regulator [Hyphomicrobiales bacterium]
MPTGKARGKSLHIAVAQDIGARILKGEFAPGTLLPNEAEWCRVYKVSRTAVREAIKTLSGKGMILSRPKIGSRVEPRSSWNLLDRDVLTWYSASVNYERFAREVQQIRFMIEPEAAALAAANRTPEQLAEIEAALADMIGSQDAVAWNIADVRFHLTILNASGNELIVPFGRAIESMLAKLFEFTVAQRLNPRDALSLHEAILKAIRARRPEAARKAARNLIADTQNTINRAARREKQKRRVLSR